jgi:hypothetical protein
MAASLTDRELLLIVDEDEVERRVVGAMVSADRGTSANFWTRWLPTSAAETLPEESVARPSTPSNCPSAEPCLPHLVMKVPSEVNFWMRAFWKSAT